MVVGQILRNPFKIFLKYSEGLIISKYEICVQRFLRFGLPFFFSWTKHLKAPAEFSTLHKQYKLGQFIKTQNAIDWGVIFATFKGKHTQVKQNEETWAECGNRWESLPASIGMPAALPQRLLQGTATSPAPKQSPIRTLPLATVRDNKPRAAHSTASP